MHATSSSRTCARPCDTNDRLLRNNCQTASYGAFGSYNNTYIRTPDPALASGDCAFRTLAYCSFDAALQSATDGYTHLRANINTLACSFSKGNPTSDCSIIYTNKYYLSYTYTYSACPKAH